MHCSQIRITWNWWFSGFVIFIFSVLSGRGQDFGWPVDRVSVSQQYGCRDCLSGTPSPRYLSGVNSHTGVDLRPDPNFPTTTRVKTAAECTVVAVYGLAGQTRLDGKPSQPTLEKISLWNDLNGDRGFNSGEIEAAVATGFITNNHGLGMTVIVSNHNWGNFSVYAHLAAVRKDIYTNFTNGVTWTIPRGEAIAIMGGSGFESPTLYATHLHFEIKEKPELGALGAYYGYVPGHPDLYSYRDPREYISNIVVGSLSPVSVENTTGETIPILNAPGSNYSGQSRSRTNALFGAGQKFIASKYAPVEGHIWYYLHLPSRTTGIGGPDGGWVSDEFVVENPSVLQLQVAGSGVDIWGSPGADQPSIGKIFDGARFVSAGLPQSGSGCTRSWTPIYVSGLPTTVNRLQAITPSIGWVCNQYLTTPPPSVGATLRCIADGTGVPVTGAKITFGGEPLADSDEFGRFTIPADLCGTKLLTILKGSLFFSQIYTVLCPQTITHHPTSDSVSVYYANVPEDLLLQSTNGCFSIPVSARFNVGDRVEVFGTSIGLRARYLTPCGDVRFVAQPGAVGTILAGPQCCNGYTRWKIRYDNYPDLEVWSAEGEPETGEFYLRTAEVSANCSESAEPNDRSINATFLPLGRDTNGFICTPMDVDWFRVNIGDYLALHVSLGIPVGKDFELEIYGPDGRWLAGSYSASTYETLLVPVRVLGDYFIRVYSFPLAEGNYSATQPFRLSTTTASSSIVAEISFGFFGESIIEWDATLNFVYAVQVSDSLSSPNWRDVDFPFADRTRMSWVDPDPRMGSRFYRIQLLE